MSKAYRRQRPLLGTYVEIGVPRDSDISDRAAESVATQAFESIAEIQRLVSFHDPASDLSRLNSAPGKEVTLHPLSVRILLLAKGITQASQELFNCTLGGRLVQQGILPDHGGPAPLESGNADDIEIRGRIARLLRPVRVTLDGIAKGYAVDLAVQSLQKNGISSGWVNAGGDLRVFGETVLPVQRREEDGTLATLGGLRQAALATSGIRSIPDRRFPGWIQSSKDSSPQKGVFSVIARSAWRADALTKVASLSDEAERAGRIRALGGLLA